MIEPTYSRWHTFSCQHILFSFQIIGDCPYPTYSCKRSQRHRHRRSYLYHHWSPSLLAPPVIIIGGCKERESIIFNKFFTRLSLQGQGLSMSSFLVLGYIFSSSSLATVRWQDGIVFSMTAPLKMWVTTTASTSSPIRQHRDFYFQTATSRQR